jgi:DNA-binding response OmpR family regulator
MKILAVDDETSVMQSMRFIFAGPRYEVTGAESGDDALSKLDANLNVYDVIIVDQKMPYLTGVELVEQIRKRSFPGKILVLSAHLSQEIRAAYQQLGVHVLLDKPFDIRELRLAVERLAA